MTEKELEQKVNELSKRLDCMELVMGVCTGVTASGETITAIHEAAYDNVTHHCGQDADEHQPDNVTYRDLLGMEVISYGGKAMKCEGCSWDCGNCVKVELVGGDYLCLAKPQEDEQPVISFDEEEGNVMDDIREKAEAFMDYLDSIVSNGKD